MTWGELAALAGLVLVGWCVVALFAVVAVGVLWGRARRRVERQSAEVEQYVSEVRQSMAGCARRRTRWKG
jgi:hypothetical protein